MKLSAKKKLNKILADNKSGSTDILIKLIRLNADFSNDRKTLLEINRIANNKLKTFSIIQSFIKNFKKVISGNNEEKILVFLTGEKDKIENRQLNLFKNSYPYLKNCRRLVTLSNSKTVVEILKRLNKKSKFSIAVAESRPQFEGRILARELLRNKIKVKIVPDSLLSNVVEEADAALIGADLVLGNGNVVNKIGSRNLAIICKYLWKPFYVLAARDKLTNVKEYFPGKRNKSEIWNNNHKLLTRTNYYFEVIEKKLITKIITD